MTDVALTSPQTEFYQSTAKATCAVAGFGSGKTEGAMFRMISSMRKFPGADMLYTAPTIPLIRDILWSKLDDFLPPLGYDYTINKAESIVYIHGLGKIFCRSMDNPDRLVGFEVVDAFLDELDILPRDKALNVFRKVKARCRQKIKDPYGPKKFKKNQQWVTTTPEGFRATYELFSKEPLPDSHLVQMSTYSNEHNLPEDYIEDLKQSYPAQLIDAYLLGKFVNLVAAPVWSGYDPVGNDVTDVAVIPGEKLYIGQDFNVGRGCAIVYVHRVLPGGHPFNPNKHKPWNILIAIDEVVDSFDTPDTARALNERWDKSVFTERVIYPDLTGTSRKSVNATMSDLSVMKAHDFQIRKSNRKKNFGIKDRVTASNAAFCNSQGYRRAFVDKKRCPVFSEGLIQQVYDNNGLPQKGVNKHDDITDAGTYPVAFHFPLERQRAYMGDIGGL